MKHIVFITPGFAANEQDSRCIPALQALVKALSRQPGLKLSVITLHYPFQRGQYRWQDVSVYACHSVVKGYAGKLLAWHRALRIFRRIHQQEPVQGIHSFWFGECALLGNYLKKRWNLPHWVNLMGQDAQSGNRYLRLLNPRRMQVIALSPFQQRQWTQTSGTPAQQLIPIGIDPDDMPALVPQPRDIQLLGVGSLTPLKNYATFLRVAAALKVELPDLKAVLIGPGPERAALEQQARELGLEQTLTFTGALPREQVMAYMMRSQVLLHPSTYESFGYVFAEALYYGMQVVSFEVGLAMASGRWAVAKDEAGLLQGVKDKLHNPDSSSLLLHSITETSQRYTDLYEAS